MICISCGFEFIMNRNICRECLVSFFEDLPPETDKEAIEIFSDPDKRKSYQDKDIKGRE